MIRPDNGEASQPDSGEVSLRDVASSQFRGASVRLIVKVHKTFVTEM
jgi:hypothetical protein